MNKMLTLLCVCAAMSSAAVLQAATLTFTPSDADLEGLDHDYMYVWKISGVSLPAGEQITGASLSFDNIQDWNWQEDDHLYLRLLSSADINKAVNTDHVVSSWKTGIYRGYDNESGGDSLAAYGTALTTYVDTTAAAEDYTYQFNAAQKTLLGNLIAADGIFGIGFDPDCHYDNCGIQMKIDTARTPSVPAPGAFLLVGMGTAVVGWVRRSRLQSAK
jgi:hypothetical protein